MSESTERQVAEIYQAILDLEQVLPSDDIFSLGGDSLQAVRIALEIELRFKVSLPIELLESSGGVSQIAAWLDAQRAHSAEAAASDPGRRGESLARPADGA